MIYPHPEIDPDWETSYLTAHGVLRGIQACVREVNGEDSLAGRRILIQGMGKVGDQLARILQKEGARLAISDIDPEKVRALAPRKTEGIPASTAAGLIAQERIDRARERRRLARPA